MFLGVQSSDELRFLKAFFNIDHVEILGCFFFYFQTFVYGDLYRFDVEKQEWKLISSPNSPPPRSAHQAVAWKNYLYIFGKR